MINLFLPSKKTLIIISGLVVIIIIITIVSALSTPAPITEPLPSPISLSSLRPTNNLPLNASPLPEIPTTDTEPQIYQEGSLEKDYERITNKKELTPEEVAAKQAILAPLEGNSGIVTANSSFNVEYLRTPQYFMVEILSNDTQAAKQAAQAWFNERGLSNNAICNLPVIFYVSPSVRDYLAQTNTVFDPTLEGCQ